MRFFLFLSFFLFPFSVSAQNEAQGCDGSRYLDDLFTDVVRTTVRFGENQNTLGQRQELFMDVYEPQGDELEKRPVIIWAFGGAFVSGCRESMAELCIEFAKKGYVAATIDYRLWRDSNPFAIPDSTDIMDIVIKSVGDYKAAIRYFRQDADMENRFRADPDFIFAGGISAGAIAALHSAYLEEGESMPDFLQKTIDQNGGLEGNSGDEQNLSYSSSVQAVINLSGGLYLPEWIDENDPPLASFHGTTDEVVPFGFGLTGINILGFRVDILSINGSKVLHQRANDLSLSNELVAVEGGGHTDIYSDPQYESSLQNFSQKNLQLLQKILCGESISSVTSADPYLPIKAFPNPSDDLITLGGVADKGQYQVGVYNALGQFIYHIESDEDWRIRKDRIGRGYFIAVLVERTTGRIAGRQQIVFH